MEVVLAGGDRSRGSQRKNQPFVHEKGRARHATNPAKGVQPSNQSRLHKGLTARHASHTSHVNPIINWQRSAYQLSVADKAFFPFHILYSLYSIYSSHRRVFRQVLPTYWPPKRVSQADQGSYLRKRLRQQG